MRQLIILGLLAFSGLAQSTTVELDTNTSTYLPSTGYAVLRIHTMVQTFTVGTTGTLNSVAVRVKAENNAYEDLTMSVWTLDGNDRRQNLLGSVSLATSELPIYPYTFNFQTFDVSALGINVSAGDRLAIALDSDAVQSFVAPAERYFWGTTSGADTYAGGKAYGCSIADVQSCLEQDWDFQLRTYVAAVPVPAAVWLFASGLGLLSWFKTRKD